MPMKSLSVLPVYQCVSTISAAVHILLQVALKFSHNTSKTDVIMCTFNLAYVCLLHINIVLAHGAKAAHQNDTPLSNLYLLFLL